MALTPSVRMALCRSLQSLSIRSASSASTTSLRIQEDTLTQEQKDKHYPRIGSRDIVGYGFNGQPCYMDSEMFPFPAIRFREETSEVTALRKKELGDWGKMTVDEKKTLYRHSFCQTFTEMNAPTGEWKSVLAGILFVFSLAGWTFFGLKKFVYPPLPSTFTPEWVVAEAEEMVRQGQGRLTGISSNWDYENNCWKK